MCPPGYGLHRAIDNAVSPLLLYHTDPLASSTAFKLYLSSFKSPK